ncbi:hypothetical protein SAMN05421823_107272 [Catalinimonas alkaloidigena]|uniref:HPt domain-containing protein n=1 Tax=Catalinimonas alkaloidigena TaxID=1075417 RepID=A0A1G9M5B8_9BACT|nr:hypothetical protein [Catalinimonas alkaloidigena]SDL69406.1 hypothetical protein SAMN05421823_107272 [Catalinimonas alkaloidigena]
MEEHVSSSEGTLDRLEDMERTFLHSPEAFQEVLHMLVERFQALKEELGHVVATRHHQELLYKVHQLKGYPLAYSSQIFAGVYAQIYRTPQPTEVQWQAWAQVILDEINAIQEAARRRIAEYEQS